jgi:hypothetical protein
MQLIALIWGDVFGGVLERSVRMTERLGIRHAVKWQP